MIRLISVAAFALALATSAQAMPVAPLDQSDGMITQVREAALISPAAHFCSERNSGRERPLRNPPKLTRLVVGCLPSPRKHYIVVGRRAALENELRLSSRFVVDGAEVAAGKRHNKLSLPHDTPNFRSPPPLAIV